MPAYTSRVYQVGSRWEYQVLQDGVVSIHQDFHPDQSGHVVMSQASATAWAAEAIAQCVFNDAQAAVTGAANAALECARQNKTDQQAAVDAAFLAAQMAAMAAQAARDAAMTAALATV